MSATAPIPYADIHALTEAVLRAGVMLSDLLGNLPEDLPEDAFEGESCVDVLLETMTGTIAPVADAAGAVTVHDTTALLGAMCDRVIADLRAALELSRQWPAQDEERHR